VRVKNADVHHPSSTVVMHRRKSASPVHNVLTTCYGMRTAKGTAGTYECGTPTVMWKLNFGTESNSTVSITRSVPVCRLKQVVTVIACALSPGTREKGGIENYIENHC